MNTFRRFKQAQTLVQYDWNKIDNDSSKWQ
jgi:hypothetical protein